MTELKIVIGDPKTGKCTQKVIDSKPLEGKKLGETIKGELIDLAGYEFLITGGSDHCGFPMRKGIQGARKRILITKGVGFRGGRKGMRKRKTVCGEVITAKVHQLNLKVTKQGSKPLTEAPTETPAEKAPEEKK